MSKNPSITDFASFWILLIFLPVLTVAFIYWYEGEWNNYDAKCTIYETKFEEEESKSPSLSIDEDDCSVEMKLGHFFINIPTQFKQIMVIPKEEK